MERDAFLAAVRTAVRRDRVPGAPGDDPGPLVPNLPPADPVTLFCETLERVDGHFHTGDPRSVLEEIVGIYGPGPFLSWDDECLPVPGASRDLRDLGCERVDATVPADPGARRAHQWGYMDVRFGLTGAEAAFAETGSIVVRSGAGQPRMASLVPLIHIALLPSERIFRSPMHWLVEAGADVSTDANVVYITGPSRTADIEQQLNLGVHGPRELHVVLV